MNNVTSIVENDNNDWFQANQNFLSAFVKYTKHSIKQAYHTDSDDHSTTVKEDLAKKIEQIKQSVPGIAPIDYLAHLFQLNEFEQQVLLLCIAPELDSDLLYPNGQKDPIVINFSLALAIFPNPDWQAITAGGALRKNSLIQLDDHKSITQSRLLVPESVVHFIIGLRDEDQELKAYSEEIQNKTVVLDSANSASLNDMANLWQNNLQKHPCLFTIIGEVHELKKDQVLAFAQKLEKRLLILPARFIPHDHSKLRTFVAKWEREIRLHNYLLMVDCDTKIEGAQEQEYFTEHFLNLLNCSVICASDDRRSKSIKEQFIFEIHKPSAEEQFNWWKKSVPVPESDIRAVISHFDLCFSQIHTIANAYHTLESKDSLWNMCRKYTRQRMHSLAERIELSEGARNIILPKPQKKSLNSIIAHVMHKSTVYDDWGFTRNSSRGRGLIALFYGASGTGKTTAAEYLATELNLDLYRVDLSNIVSKYIGETEKNLNQIFTAAERTGAILLFDEADALFSKRTQVSGSHDKFANAQVSYLLQRLESFQGLAILTSNLKDSFDTAFIRRLRFVIQFPFPTAIEREKIWRTILPANAPTKNIDFNKLARLNTSGGVIRNIMLNACFNAASDNESLQMQHFLDAARIEYAKHDKSLSMQEVQGWV
jgi:AAA+ superfamily predicted ATPase